MKIASYKIFILASLCLLLLGCNKKMSNGLIVFDVNGNYPIKELDIEDVTDIEYLVLDVSDDNYLFRYFHTMTDSFIICNARNELLFFSRLNGKPVSKVSQYGQGPGEYMSTRLAVYSEISDELFLYDNYTEISVYTKYGTFKRKFPLIGGELPSSFFIAAMYDFDEKHLLLHGYCLLGKNMRDSSFMIVSKQDGFMDVIKIPVEKRIYTTSWDPQGKSTVADNYFAVRNENDFLLTDYSSDTVYRFTPDRMLIPVLVRKPSIQKMETKIFLHSWLETGMYLFFSTQQQIYMDPNIPMPPHKGYLMEKNSGKFFRIHIQMRDYKGKELFLGSSVIHKSSNGQTGIVVLNALELQEANKENKLSGKLKEVTDRLTEVDEYVFMILNFK